MIWKRSHNLLVKKTTTKIGPQISTVILTYIAIACFKNIGLLFMSTSFTPLLRFKMLPIPHPSVRSASIAMILRLYGESEPWRAY